MRPQKRLAGTILKCSKSKIWLDPSRKDEVKEAITKADVRRLIIAKVIKKKAVQGPSKVRSRKTKEQKRKGRQRGQGSRKGKKTARLSQKDKWINGIRAQRELLKKLRDAEYVDAPTYRTLYKKAKGGFFRSKRHIKLYIEEQGLLK